MTKKIVEQQLKPNEIRCVVVGDSFVGKSLMLTSFISNTFPINYLPTVIENYSTKLTINGEEVNLLVNDTAGDESYDRLRPLSYPNTDIALICYSVESLISFNNVLEKWYPEIKHYCPKTSIILVGTKIDLRDDEETVEKLRKNKQVPITSKQGEELKDKIAAFKYIGMK